MTLSNEYTVKIFLFLALVANIGLWFSARGVQAKWMNVPPAPEQRFASAYGLGDPQLSYRSVGIMIQNMGDAGGRTTSLSDYNYEELVKWFFFRILLILSQTMSPIWPLSILAGFRIHRSTSLFWIIL